MSPTAPRNGEGDAQHEEWSMHWDHDYQQYYWLHTSGYSQWVEQEDESTLHHGSYDTSGSLDEGVTEVDFDRTDAGDANDSSSKPKMERRGSFRQLSLDTKRGRQFDSASPSPSVSMSVSQLGLSGFDNVSEIRMDEESLEDVESTTSHRAWRSSNKKQTNRLVQMFGLSPRGKYWVPPAGGAAPTGAQASGLNDVSSQGTFGRSLLERALTSPSRDPKLNGDRPPLRSPRFSSLSNNSSVLKSPPADNDGAREATSAPGVMQSREASLSSFASPPPQYRSMRVSAGEESMLAKFVQDESFDPAGEIAHTDVGEPKVHEGVDTKGNGSIGMLVSA